MTMKEHLDALTKELASGVTLSAEEASTRKAAIVQAAQTEVASQLLASRLLTVAVKAIPSHIKAAHEARSKCLEIIDQMQHEDVTPA